MLLREYCSTAIPFACRPDQSVSSLTQNRIAHKLGWETNQVIDGEWRLTVTVGIPTWDPESTPLTAVGDVKRAAAYPRYFAERIVTRGSRRSRCTRRRRSSFLFQRRSALAFQHRDHQADFAAVARRAGIRDLRGVCRLPSGERVLENNPLRFLLFRQLLRVNPRPEPHRPKSGLLSRSCLLQ